MKDKIFFLKHKLLGKNSIDLYNQQVKNEVLDIEKLADLNFEKRKRMFSFAKSNIKAYQRLYSNINVKDISNSDDWERLPILTKSYLKDNINDFTNKEMPNYRFREVTTGGSTGVPTKVFHDTSFPLETLTWRTLRWWGCNPSDNIGFVYRITRTSKDQLFNDAMWFPTRRVFLDASTMTRESMLYFYNRALKFKIVVLQGYVGAVVEFAKFCSENNFQLPDLRCIWVTSAPLSQSNRILLTKAFSVPVYDQYGCSEVHWIAAECSSQSGLHVHFDHRHIEFVDEETSKVVQKGNLGNVLITDLENFAFPLIRYENGDRGRWLNRKCDCGNSLPLIDKIRGRVSDTLTLLDDTKISGDYLTTIFDEDPEAVEQFQIKQLKSKKIVIYCVLSKAEDSKKRALAMYDKFLLKFYNSNDFNIDFVGEITHDRGKSRFIVKE